MDNKDEKDVLLAFNREHYARLQHYETQRTAASNLLVIIAAAILAFVTFDKALTIADLPLTILLLFIGMFGAAFCVKYYERASRQMQLIRFTRRKIDALVLDSKLLDNLRDDADAAHALEFPRFHAEKPSLRHAAWWKIYRLWIAFHLFIALLGLILSILIYFV